MSSNFWYSVATISFEDTNKTIVPKEMYFTAGDEPQNLARVVDHEVKRNLILLQNYLNPWTIHSVHSLEGSFVGNVFQLGNSVQGGENSNIQRPTNMPRKIRFNVQAIRKVENNRESFACNVVENLTHLLGGLPVLEKYVMEFRR